MSTPSGLGLGASKSSTGNSTSQLPTVKGPLYSGKPGTRLKLGNQGIVILDKEIGRLSYVYSKSQGG